MPQSERVLEVQDGEDETHKLAQSHDEGDGEGGALGGEDEDTPDAHIPGHAGLREFPVEGGPRGEPGRTSGVVLGFSVHILRTRTPRVGYGSSEAPGRTSCRTPALPFHLWAHLKSAHNPPPFLF